MESKNRFQSTQRKESVRFKGSIKFTPREPNQKSIGRSSSTIEESIVSFHLKNQKDPHKL